MRKYNGYYSTTSTKYILAQSFGYSLDDEIIQAQTKSDKVIVGTGTLSNFDDLEY